MLLSECLESILFEKWEKNVEIKSTGQYADKTIKELEKEIRKVKKQTPSSNKKKKLGQLYFALRAKKGFPKGEGSVKVGK